MKMIIEVPDNKVPFIMELFSKFEFINFKTEIPKTLENNFEKEWKAFSSKLNQSQPKITNEEIDTEIKAVRQGRRQTNNLSAQQ